MEISNRRRLYKKWLILLGSLIVVVFMVWLLAADYFSTTPPYVEYEVAGLMPLHITGHAGDADYAGPIPVRVRINGQVVSTMTDAEGQFSVEGPSDFSANTIIIFVPNMNRYGQRDWLSLGFMTFDTIMIDPAF